MGGFNLFNSDIENPVARAIFMILDPAGGAAATMGLVGGSDFASEVEYKGKDDPRPQYGGANALLNQQTLAGELQNGQAGTGVQPTPNSSGIMDTSPSGETNYLPGADRLLGGYTQPNIYSWV